MSAKPETSAPVDVLAVIGDLIDLALNSGGRRGEDETDNEPAVALYENAVKARAAVAELVVKGAALLPTNLCLDNTNIPDSTEIPLVATMGELRAFRAALAKFGGA